MGADVRLATTAAEREAVFAVRHEVFIVGQDVPFDIERDELDATADHVLAEVDGRVVGAGRLLVGGNTAVLGRLAVLDAWRGSGLGVRLVQLIEDRARARGCSVLELHAQTYVREFYQRLGYAAYGEEYDEAGIPHISMSKIL
jgi:predicted GNAT family N-acyltransferase